MEFECQESTEAFKNLANCSETNHFTSNSVTEDLELSKLSLDCNPKKGNSSSCSSKQLPPNDVFPSIWRTITDLPPALISEILNCLDPKELGVVSCVSTTLHNIASEHRVWKDFYCERWGLPAATRFSDEKSWKELFVEREYRSKTFLGRYSIDVLHGHTEAVRTVFLLASAKLIFTAGYDSVVRMWDMEEGLLISSSQPLGCTIRAVAADTKLLVAGGTDGFVHCWKAVEGLKRLFDLKGVEKPNTEFRLWEHEGPITSLALDLTRIYSGSWDMTVRVWDRSSLRCTQILRHGDWVWSLVPHDTTVASTSGSDVYVWETNSGTLLSVIHNAHVGYTYALARSRTGDFLYTGGEDGAVHMFEIITESKEHSVAQVATWIPHLGAVYALAFEFPWLVSASSDGKLALIDVRKLLRASRRSLGKRVLRVKESDRNTIEPPQRMLHGFGCNLYSVDIGADRIVCGGEGGVVRIWNFSQALEIEQRARALKGIRLENRLRRRRLQIEMNGKGGQSSRCSVAAKKNPVNGDRDNSVWHSKRDINSKVKT
ncbi:hypothetical protein GQ457_15G028480 [Hibiscus cannabinus]